MRSVIRCKSILPVRQCVKGERVLLEVLKVLVFVVVLLIFTAQCLSSSADVSIENCKQAHWDIPVNTFEAPRVLRDIDKDIGKYDAGHRGVDFAAEPDDPIYAPEDGELTYRGSTFGTPTITFSTDGLKNTFQPAASDLKKGTQVKKGEIIGRVSSAEEPHCEVSCVHWGVRDEDENYLFPLSFVYKNRIVLK
ncbi:MAG: M23 family metallopeptidase [Candidatus Ancillula sp.]|jgi:hypothetical protein|nr:M23 family metallopeptidase [Candidatus Ancillula sp.]